MSEQKEPGAALLERNPSLVPIYEELLATATDRDVLVGREELERIRELGLKSKRLWAVYQTLLQSKEPDRGKWYVAKEEAGTAFGNAGLEYRAACDRFFGVAP